MPNQPQGWNRNHQPRPGHAPEHIRLWGAAQRHRCDQLPEGKRVGGRIERGHQIGRSPGAKHTDPQEFIPIQQLTGETDHHESSDKNPPKQTMPWAPLATRNRQQKGQKGADIAKRHM